MILLHQPRGAARRVGRAAFAIVLPAAIIALSPTSPVFAQDTPPAMAPASGAPTDAALAITLEEIRRATEKYRDVSIAERDGYLRDPMDMCVTAEMEGFPPEQGEMGIHYFRPDLLGLTGTEPRVAGVGTHEDFRQPGVLVYEPQADGSLELVAVENLIFEAGWNRGGPPEFLGHRYHRLADDPRTDVDEAHGFEPHYELHIWLYRENPTGLFTPFNPDVSCRHHGGHGGL